MKTIKAKVHRLPTEDTTPSILVLPESIELPAYTTENHAPHHLYFTTDEVAKKGDYYIHQDLGKQPTVKRLEVEGDFLAKKIIATTDPKLKIDVLTKGPTWIYDAVRETKGYCKESINLPQIPQSFIEEYCKAGGIDEVLVEYERIPHTAHWIWRPKLNPDNTIIIHPVEEKMYSREELEEIVYNATKEVPNEDQETVLKWIEENL